MIFDITRAVFAAAVACTSVAFEDKHLLWWWLLLIPWISNSTKIINVGKEHEK